MIDKNLVEPPPENEDHELDEVPEPERSEDEAEQEVTDLIPDEEFNDGGE